MKPLGLYIHIPFCRRKCHYCDFVSYPGMDSLFYDYIDALLCEAGFYSDYLSGHIIDTVFIGGGTPSLLSPEQITRLISGIKNTCRLDLKEMTIEANPETLDDEKLLAYHDAGINRLSIGLQSHDDDILFNIGRRHTYETFLKAYKSARKYFDNINTDIIFGLPGQTEENFETTLQNIIDISPEHISVYSLKLEPGTKLYETFSGADDDTDRNMYHKAAYLFSENGYEHYETSNFSKPGYECVHNLKYWVGEEYLGLGAAAHSYIFDPGKERFGNVDDLQEYMSLIEKGEKPIAEKTLLSPSDEMIEYIMLRLRLKQGINFEDFNSRFNKNFKEMFENQIKNAENSGLIKDDTEHIYPTLLGFDLQNTLITDFIKLI